MLRGMAKKGLSHWGKLRRGKMTKFWLEDKNFLGRNFSPTNIMTYRIFQGKVSKFPYFYHKCSIQCTNLSVDVNNSNVVQISGQGLPPNFLCYQ